MKPLLKYKGGKYRDIKYFSRYLPSSFSTYFEPFFGGGSLYFYLEPSKAIVGDINEKLMSFYQGLKDNFFMVQYELLHLSSDYEKNLKVFLQDKELCPDIHVPYANETLYYRMRDMFNVSALSNMFYPVLYYFINKTAYSGMIRYNSEGHFNVAYGFYKNFSVSPLFQEGLQDLLNRTEFFCADYQTIMKKVCKDDFVFLDPPYLTKFNDYGNSSDTAFDRLENIKLFEFFRKLKCKTLLILGQDSVTESLFSDYIVDRYHKNYSVNIQNRFKHSNTHLIIKNF